MSKDFSLFIFEDILINLIPNVRQIDLLFPCAYYQLFYIAKLNPCSGIYVLGHITCNLLNNTFPLKRSDLLKGKMYHNSFIVSYILV